VGARALYGSLGVLLVTLLLASTAVLYVSWQDTRIRDENRRDIVRFVCIATRLSSEEQLRIEFRQTLDAIGESCPSK
jgi:hypothetical protein